MQYGFAVDIGTTNIEISLWKLETDTCETSSFHNTPIKTKSVRNCLYVYGADVVSRILYAHYNGVEVLQKKLIAQLKEEFDLMLRDVQDDSSGTERLAKRAVLTGNTVMLHFLSGLSVAGFEKAPFTPVSLFGEAGPAASALASLAKEVILPPCISAFLGADIVCASLAVESDTHYVGGASCASGCSLAGSAGDSDDARDKPYIVIDIGTNTEIMLVSADGKRTACSAAAGPAFEGGGLSVDMKGSALVSELARMLDEDIMDETGYLGADDTPGDSCKQSASAEHDSDGNKRRTQLTQQDVRQLQLAKGATAAAVETLLLSVAEGAATESVKRCFICGNFGNALDVEAVKKTGLLPAELADCAVYAGNAALRGAEYILLSKTAALQALEIAQKTAVLQLADSAVFAEKYIQNMSFRA